MEPVGKAIGGVRSRIAGGTPVERTTPVMIGISVGRRRGNVGVTTENRTTPARESGSATTIKVARRVG